jgi:Fic family protein
MKKPRKPPDFSKLLDKLAEYPAEDQTRILQAPPRHPGPSKYLHWDDVSHLTPPEGFTRDDWWLSLKLQRMGALQDTPLLDKTGRPFEYLLNDYCNERLHRIDQEAAGRIEVPEPITNEDTRDQYLISSLIEEATTSSQLEGATSTLPEAKEMIRTGRKPRDRSERMILNNFITMQRILDIKDQALSGDLVFQIHRLVTKDTLDAATEGGRFRTDEERVQVRETETGEIFHTPPAAHELPQRMEAMCDFANNKAPQHFVHPVVRSILLHFWLAYDHPFVDGNGRTARALFYWSMLHHGYWLFQYVSISRIIHMGPAKYSKAFLYTESDNNDLTYFLIYHLDVIRRAIDELHTYIKKKTAQVRALERELHSLALNHRQRALIGHALRHPYHQYTIKSHGRSHGVVHQTARTDLRGMCDKGLLSGQKQGKTWYFTPVSDLEQKLRELK